MDAAGNVTVLFASQAVSAATDPARSCRDWTAPCTARQSAGARSTSLSVDVYRFDPATRAYKILHTFVISDGRDPTGKLFQAANGFFYGTTNEGGAWNAGVVYRVTAAGAFAIVPHLHSDRRQPAEGGRVQASDGLFYGTLESGGYGGRIFRMDASGNLTVLHSFGPYSSAGWRPTTNPIEARDGFFYGTTRLGGTSSAGSYGVVYRLSRTGSLWVLHPFAGANGIGPSAPLLQASDTRLYGSTIVGGANGLGTLFRLGTGQPALLPTLVSLYLDPLSLVGGSSATASLTLSWADHRAARSSQYRAARRWRPFPQP